MARPVRIGLEEQVTSTSQASEKERSQLRVVAGKAAGSKKEALKPPLLDQLYYGKPKREQIREFGYLFGAIFFGAAAYYGWNGGLETLSYLSAAGVAFVGCGISAPILLYPLWSGWMMLADAISAVVSVLFVLVTWCLIAVPVGILLKIVGKKVMDLSFDRSVESYWEEREEKYHDFKLLERQF